jgi:pimeloyl-ACP methyl ester carboxylesterase
LTKVSLYIALIIIAILNCLSRIKYAAILILMGESFSRATRLTYSNDGKINGYYWVLGSKNNPSLLLLGGFTSVHGDLLPLAGDLKQKYFVIMPDLPGWGKSPRFSDTLTIENYAIYLESLLKHLKIQRVTVVGHCMGAPLTIEFAYKFPGLTEKIFLASTPYLKGTISYELFLHLASLSKHVPKGIRKIFFIFRSRLFVSPIDLFVIQTKSLKRKLRLIWHYYKIQPLENEDSVEENWVSLINYDYNKVKNLKMPVHLIHGEKDVLINKRQLNKFHKLIPSATLDLLPNAGHIPPLEAPKTLATVIMKY